MQSRILKPIVFGLAAGLLAGCGGGGGGKANVDAFDRGQPPVFADGTTVTTEKFRGQTFPFYFIAAVEGETPTDTASLARGSGRITVSADGNTLTLETDDLPVTLVRDSGDVFIWNVDVIGPIAFFQETLGPQRLLYLGDPDFKDIFDLVGTYGFQTPSGFMPGTGTATYASDSFGKLILTEAGSGAFTVFEGFSLVSLTARFGDGTMSGSLFNGTTFVDLDGDELSDDSLTILLELRNGRISGGTFGGTIGGIAAAFIDDEGAPIDLNARFSNTDVDGYFFGNAAERVGGTYEGDYRLSAELGATEGSFVGYFDALRSPD